MSDYIDEGGSQPTLAGEPRISVLDVVDLVAAEDVERAVEMWGLGEAEVEAAIEYYRENEEEMKRVREENEAVLEAATDVE